ncbi:MAG: winged helix-turn-helix domain-containing protein, partial [Eubacterium aggregans]
DFIVESSDRLVVQGAVLSTKELTLSYQDDRLELTKNEYRILKVLMEHPGQVISRDQLMEKLWETDRYIDDNTLTVNVTRLRKRLAEIGLTNFITTKRGLGYLVE